MNKKILGILFFLIFLSFIVNAIVVSNISSQITESNEQILQSNALNSAEISRLKDEINSLKTLNTDMSKKMVTKDDLPELYNNIYVLLDEHLARTLITMLFLIAFSGALVALAKSKKMI